MTSHRRYTRSDLLGHESVSTTQVYTRVVNQAARDAVGRLTL